MKEIYWCLKVLMEDFYPDTEYGGVVYYVKDGKTILIRHISLWQDELSIKGFLMTPVWEDSETVEIKIQNRKVTMEEFKSMFVATVQIVNKEPMRYLHSRIKDEYEVQFF